MGVQADLAPGTVPDEPGKSLRGSRRRRFVLLDGWRADVAGAVRLARPWIRATLAAWRRRPLPAHHSAGPERSAAAVHRHLGRRRVPDGRRRENLETDQSRAEIAVHTGPECGGGPLRASDRAASFPARSALY